MTSTENSGAHDEDPLIARHFELLEQIEVPRAEPFSDLTNRAPLLATRSIGDDRADRAASLRKRPGYVVAMAAAVAISAGAGLSALNRTSSADRLNATTSKSATNDQPADAVASSSVESTPPTVVVATTAEPRRSVASEATTTLSAPPSSASTSTQPTTAGPSTTEAPSAISSSTTAEPVTTKPPVPTTRPQTTTAKPAPSTTIAEPTSTAATTPWTSALDLATITGVVEELFTDCQSRLVLNDQGTVDNVGPISCDGGSSIVIDGVRVQTSSGFSPTQFNKHPKNVSPGQRAIATAIRGPGGLLTLDCEQCKVVPAGR